jgi:hypothetical protein
MKYADKPCGFCKDTNGTFEISQGEIAEFIWFVKEYCRYVDSGGDPELWNNGPPDGWERPEEKGYDMSSSFDALYSEKIVDPLTSGIPVGAGKKDVDRIVALMKSRAMKWASYAEMSDAGEVVSRELAFLAKEIEEGRLAELEAKEKKER